MVNIQALDPGSPDRSRSTGHDSATAPTFAGTMAPMTPRSRRSAGLPDDEATHELAKPAVIGCTQLHSACDQCGSRYSLEERGIVSAWPKKRERAAIKRSPGSPT